MHVIRYCFSVTVGLALCVTSSIAASSGIQHANVFALGGVGYAGVMSDGEKALRATLAEADATKRLETMFLGATDAGRLYILVGLRMRDRSVYRRVLALCSDHENMVQTMRGCIGDHESFRSLVHEINRGDFDSFLKRHPW